MTLEQWSKNRWLTEHESSADEITGLLSVIDRDLEDAKVARLNDRAGLVTEAEVAELVALATQLRQQLEEWLQRNTVHLLAE